MFTNMEHLGARWDAPALISQLQREIGDTLRIHRSHPDENFTILPNDALRDQRLSYTARGILAELLSHADGWETNADALWKFAQQNRGSKTGEGRRAIRAAFADLEECGYLIRRKVQGEKGRFITMLEIYDNPDDRRTACVTSADVTSVGVTSASGTSIRSTNQRSTNEEVRTEEHSAALADARAAALAARRKSQLNDLYEAVDKLTDEQLRNALLTLERRRPRIYRTCRNNTLGQLEKKDRRILKGPSSGKTMDRLSFKYALLHYYDSADEWPAWLVRPLASVGGRAA